jgi:hypothetical protein
MSRTDSVQTSWCKAGCACGRQRGGATRPQMRVFALAVTVALVGRPACVHCGTSVTLWSGQVDRTDPGSCYLPGTVLMICEDCNESLGQEGKTDIGDFDRETYKADVLRASLGITIMGPTAAQRIYAVKPTCKEILRNSPYMR